jgi:2-amino-4-hydroxy-6-hydroxymethyldihydropteridine diphosphokinase
MHTAFLGLGSNIEAERNLASAIACLRATFGEIGFSPFYRCTPFGFEGEDFINAVARVNTAMAPLQLRTYLVELENQHQRDREAPKYSSRTLDVDILLYDDLYLLSPQLEIPREEILRAAYVLKPLADLAPGLVHPVKRQRMLDLWNAFPGDKAGLRPMDFPLG